MSDLEPASALASPEEYGKHICDHVRPADTTEEADRRAAVLVAQRDTAVREPLERRVRELEGELAKAQHVAEYLAGYQADLVAIDRVLDAVDAPHDPEEGASLSPTRIRLMADRIASLEAQLASAREEALREADEAITKRIEAEEEREAKMPPGESESVIQSAAICGLEWARHELMALLTSPPKSPWVPVETPPSRTLGPVLLLVHGHVYEGHSDAIAEASHWMPMPEPPATPQQPSRAERKESSP